MPPRDTASLASTTVSQHPKAMQGFQHSGYKFQEDDIANQMAFLFGSDKGRAAAKKIREEANRRFPEPLQPLQKHAKKKFIEEQIKEYSATIDNDFHSGLDKIFNKLLASGVACQGDAAGKKEVCELMRNVLGLNIDEDNVQTHFDPGPPAVFCVTWVNRPSKDLSNPESEVNQLANAYKGSLEPEQQRQYDETWSRHTEHAKQGGPKMAKEEFQRKADEGFQDYLKKAKEPSAGLSAMQSPGESSNNDGRMRPS